jgi:hypothetical protein
MSVAEVFELIREFDLPAKVFIESIPDILAANSLQFAIGRLVIAGRVSRDFPGILSSVLGHSVLSLDVPYLEILEPAFDLLDMLPEDSLKTSRSVDDIIVSLFQGPPENILPKFVGYFLSHSTAFHIVRWVFRECTLRSTPVVVQVLEAGNLVWRYADIDVDALKLDYRQIVETFPHFGDDRYRSWVYLWARKSQSFRKGILANFKLVRTAAVEWAKFVLDDALHGIFEVYETLKQSNVHGLKAVFHWLAGKLEDERIIEVSELLAANFFVDESLDTESSAKVFSTGLSVMDGDSVFDLYLSLIEGIGELHTGEEKLNAIKACLIIEAKPDMREALLKLFPSQDTSILDAAQMEFVGGVIFGTDSPRRTFMNRTSSDDE